MQSKPLLKSAEYIEENVIYVNNVHTAPEEVIVLLLRRIRCCTSQQLQEFGPISMPHVDLGSYTVVSLRDDLRVVASTAIDLTPTVSRRHEDVVPENDAALTLVDVQHDWISIENELDFEIHLGDRRKDPCSVINVLLEDLAATLKHAQVTCFTYQVDKLC